MLGRKLTLALAASKALVVIVEAFELQDRYGDGLRAHVTMDHVGLDLGRRLLVGHGRLARRLLGQLDLLVSHVDFDAFSAVVVRALVFEALFIDAEQLLAHVAFVVGYFDVAVLTVE